MRQKNVWKVALVLILCLIVAGCAQIKLYKETLEEKIPPINATHKKFADDIAKKIKKIGVLNEEFFEDNAFQLRKLNVAKKF